ncbi:MAG: primosomal protein N' [Pseudobdellovibrionaceae bacterium]
MSQLWRIAVEAPLPEALTYSSDLELRRGSFVEVPLGKRTAQGLVLGPTSIKPDFEIKLVKSMKEDFPLLPEPFVKWIEWVSDYYLYPPGLVASSVLPPLPHTKKERASRRPPVIPMLEQTSWPELTEEQKKVFEAINSEVGFQTHLLFGVTGSGKTEVYLKLLNETLNRGKSGIVLVPEISLTPQLLHRFASRFGDQVAVIHSQLTEREKTNQWWDIVSGKKRILIGARSALFCPIQNLGMIIVDEEHEPSYKQDEKLKYHGRDSAIVLGKLCNCPVVLGSATPSMESWKNAVDGKYKLQKMGQRVQNRALPIVSVVDLKLNKEEQQKRKDLGLDLPSWMSLDLYHALRKSQDNQEQAALFLNRRGVAQVVSCPGCGFVVECPNCDISLTLHGKSHLVCHYCDYNEVLKHDCPSCKEGELKPLGVGTEQVESDISRLFPEARLARADRDEVQSRLEMEELIQKMENHEIDILIGTQMIAKGLDFPKLNTVGLVLADIGFNLPDFRASDRSFQLMTQVAGRAGRHVQPGQNPGEVIIQTLNPQHVSISHAVNHDFESFAHQELVDRSALNYPPLGRLISFRLQGNQLALVEKAAHALAHRARQLQERYPAYTNVEVLGPAEAAIAKLRGKFRYHLLLKGPRNQALNQFARQMVADESWLPRGVQIVIDVDPLHLL